MKEKNVKVEIIKNIVGYIGRACVGIFFGTVAANMTAGSNMSKFERGSVIAGGALVGLVVGNDVADYLDTGIDVIADKCSNKFLKEAEEMKGAE